MPQYKVSYRSKENGKLSKLPVFSLSVDEAEKEAIKKLPNGVTIIGVERSDGEASRAVQQF